MMTTTRRPRSRSVTSRRPCGSPVDPCLTKTSRSTKCSARPSSSPEDSVKTSDSQTRWQQQEDQGRPEDKHLQPPATLRTLVMTMIYTVRDTNLSQVILFL